MGNMGRGGGYWEDEVWGEVVVCGDEVCCMGYGKRRGDRVWGVRRMRQYQNFGTVCKFCVQKCDIMVLLIQLI